MVDLLVVDALVDINFPAGWPVVEVCRPECRPAATRAAISYEIPMNHTLPGRAQSRQSQGLQCKLQLIQVGRWADRLAQHPRNRN